MLRRVTRHHQRAFVGEILVAVIGYLFIAGGVSALGYATKTAIGIYGEIQANANRMAVVNQLAPDARSAMFVGILPTDINGAAQSGTAQEVDFYTRDSAHKAYLWAYHYDPNAHTVSRYCFDDPTTHANLQTCGPTLSGVTAFNVSVQNASSAVAGNNALTGIAVHDIAPQGLSVAGVSSSNRIATVQLTTSDANESHVLVAGIGPTGYTTIVGRYWKPGPLTVQGSSTSFAVDQPVGENTCFYVSDGSQHSPCTIGVSEQYYGGGGENQSGNFVVAQGNCPSSVTISPTTQAAQSTTPVTFTINSTAVAVCTFYITDDHGGSVPVQVTVWGPLVTSPAKLDFRVGGVTNPTAYNAGGANLGPDLNGVVTVSEQNYTGAFQLSDGDASGNNACGANVSATWNGGGWNVATPANAVPGDCTMHITDNHGGLQLLQIHVGAPLLVNAGSGFAASGALAWNRPSDGTKSYQVHESVYTGAFTVADSCNGNISDTVASGGGNGTDSSYNVTPSAGPLNCVITISDTRGNTATVSINVAQPFLVQQYVCDPAYPPSPFGTDLGPDPDGIHEDYSNGASCNPPTPPPTAPPTSSPVGCTITGSNGLYVANMPAAGGTCTMGGSTTDQVASTFCLVVNFTCRGSTINQTGTDTAGIGNYTLYEGSTDNYTGWYCYPYSGLVGCNGITIDFATMPSAAMPVRIDYTFSNYHSTGNCPQTGSVVQFWTAELHQELEQYYHSPSEGAISSNFNSYAAFLHQNGYETTYQGIDPTAQAFWVTLIPETSGLGVTCSASDSFDYTITITQQAGIQGGAYVTAPSNMTIEGP